MIVMDIAEYARLIKDERQRQGISQTDMAQRLGVTELGLSLDVRKTPQPAELYEW